MGWKEIRPANSNDAIQFIIRGENVPNPRYGRFLVRSASGFGISNEGFRGMGIRKDNQYDFSVLARVVEGNISLRIELVSEKTKSWALLRCR